MKLVTTDRMQALEQKHRVLAEQVQRLDRRAHLTPVEQRRVSDLKKLKLLAKDELFALKRDTG
jgi:uncharacterized protein YdcH (DUF465 family)